MKKVTLLFTLLCVSTLIFAQTTTQTATLKHGDNITAYYGPDALIAAHTAAQTGDVITLSSGSFNSLEITKAITIRGAGCTYDPETGTRPVPPLSLDGRISTLQVMKRITLLLRASNSQSRPNKPISSMENSSDAISAP